MLQYLKLQVHKGLVKEGSFVESPNCQWPAVTELGAHDRNAVRKVGRDWGVTKRGRVADAPPSSIPPRLHACTGKVRKCYGVFGINLFS